MTAESLLLNRHAGHSGEHWWRDVPRWLDSGTAAPQTLTAAYRLGDVVLVVDSTYAPLIDELENAYGDCAVAESDALDMQRLRCSARRIDDHLVSVKFEASGLPQLAEVAFRLIRHRTELQHFSLRDAETPGWKFIANGLDDDSALLAGNDAIVVLDTRLEPPEFLTNFIIGVAQIVQSSLMFIHAGGVSVGGHGVLLIGQSGRGKSTTSVAVASRGHALLGDETVGVRPETRELFAFRRTVKLRPGVRPERVVERLEEVDYGLRLDAQGLECAWVRPSDLFPGSSAPTSVPIDAVFFLHAFADQPSAERFVPKLADIEELHALTGSLSAIVSWPSTAAHRLIRFVRLIDLFERTPCYFLTLGTPDETAALIERILLEKC